jgi:oxygen-independent coproporphyrinogen-3 oxidase
VALAVYIHFPWCLQRCPYCDFATEAIAPRNLQHRAYADAVIAELARRREHFPDARLGTVFFGGGTPSLWEPVELGRVLAAITEHFGPAHEVTVECNPTSLDVARAEALRAVGVNRLSVGIQSLRDHHLRYLGRLHDAAGARRAVREAASVAGLRVSADVMFGMPAQQAGELLEDTAELMDAGVRHVSAYALTIEPETRFGELARKGRLPRLPDEAVATLFEALDGAMARAGWSHYEVSNYAAPGEEARHNLAYWRGEAYLGLGAGAVGCWHEGPGRAVRYRNLHQPEAYMAAGAAGRLPPDEREQLDAQTMVREGLMLGLRTREGVDLARLGARAGVNPREGRERAIAAQVARGNLEDHGDRLAIPQARWLTADDIVATLF